MIPIHILKTKKLDTIIFKLKKHNIEILDQDVTSLGLNLYILSENGG